jgi:predicted O-methyltransferase YrrM
VHHLISTAAGWGGLPTASDTWCLAVGSTSAYRDMKYLPPLVHAAVNLAAEQGFDHSCAPEQGRLLSVLARGWSGGRVGETGTGYGVGLAWMVETAHPSTSFVSIEKDHIEWRQRRACSRRIPRSGS